MQKVIDFFGGMVRAEAECRYPERFINICSQNGISFKDMARVDGGKIQLTLSVGDYKKLVSLAKGGVFSVRAVHRIGMPFFLRRIRKRYALLAGMLLCLCAVGVLSLFIWEIDVSGNEKVSDYEILAALDEVGVGVGSCHLTISQSRVSNEMLLRIPELCWITVNTHGSRAEVLVREEIPMPEIVNEDQPCLVYAKKTGIITKTVVWEGKQLLHAGDTVLAGETIVTGAMDSLSSGTRYVHAMADVYARTWYELSAEMPLETYEKEYTGEETTKFSVVIGGKRINFYHNSGIVWPEYDKIITEKRLTLPGETVLPFSLIRETYVEYTGRQSAISEDAARQMLEAHLLERLDAETDGGEIVNKEFDVQVTDGVMTVTVRAECIEQIGAVRPMTDAEMPPDAEMIREEEVA